MTLASWAYMLDTFSKSASGICHKIRKGFKDCFATIAVDEGVKKTQRLSKEY